MAELLYRMVSPSDINVLVELRMAFLGEVAGGDINDAQLREAVHDYFALTLPRREFVAYVAEAAGAVIATSGMVFHQHPPSPANPSGREAFIMNMYTVPAHRGRGIATELLRRLLDHARRQGCGSAVLHALPRGRSIYERAGFVATETEMRLSLANT